MSESLHTRVIFHAAQIMGGAAALAQALGVSITEVQAWMRSEIPIPEPRYAELLDVIAEDTLNKLSDLGRADESGAGRLAEQRKVR